MNDKSEREQDAAVIAKYRAWLPEYHALTEHDWTPETDERGGELYEFIVEGSEGIIAAALREIDRLTAERDGAYAEYLAQLLAFRDDANERQRRVSEERDRIMHVLFGRDLDPDERMTRVLSLKTRLDWLNKTLDRLDLAGVWTGADQLLDDRVAQIISERDAERTENKRLRAACELVASSLESNLGYATGKPDFWSGAEGREIVQHAFRNAANNLRAALGINGDGDE